ncbi:TetR/AcrR family transcriptional regulator [Flagellimonas allohymeniacidonis]|uniref:TetR/AcrR family transcriptional regulator n=1 Tax=Flagellimonas allohymeniacidonis TaxID=2517819 RepID=A0A4Q8Q9P7_9FLAO|nr:TetR/AcrR family transcriptional regulator [Allomuricauda hymeniacidonis]TAI47005.1 TetR/AcrR family transcriptional regulator [Allomuricauda hymeniacidonis]
MERKTEKGEMKNDTLLEKGMEILWSKGYNATSINDIVEAAGVPKGSFYFYFKSKEDFTVKAIEKYFGTMFPPALEVLQNKSVSPKQRILDFYEFRSQVLKDELNCKMGCMACNLASEMAEHNEEIRKAIEVKTQLVNTYITEAVEEAQEYGEIDTTLNAADLVAFLEDAGKGAMVTMKERNSAYPIDNFMSMVRKLI